jgi:signal transduction histidine kinase
MVDISTHFKRIVFISSALIIAISISVLLVWQFDILTIKNAFPDRQISNPVTALCFISSVLALHFLSKKETGLKIGGVALASVVLLVGGLVFSSIVFGFQISIDKTLYSDKLFLYGNKGKPNYMAPNTALCFLISGLSLATYPFRQRFTKYISDALAFTCALIAFASVLGYMYGANQFYDFKARIPMAFPTAFCFFLIALAILFARSSFGTLYVFTEDYPGSKMARRLIPLAVAVTVFLDMVSIKGEQHGLYSKAFGTVLFSTISLVIFIALLWISGIYLNAANKNLHREIAMRIQLNSQLEEVNQSLEDKVREKSQLLVAQATRHQRELLQASFDGQEAERKHIGMELHDNVNQMLATASLYLDMGMSSPDQQAGNIATCRQQIHAAIKEIRRLSQSLVLYKIEGGNLYEAIMELIEPVMASRGIRCVVAIPDQVSAQLSVQQLIAAYRIVQEQLNNIIKYAEASMISIELADVNGSYELMIRDNGKGFDPAKKRTGIGLSNIESRVDLLNGEMVLHAAPGEGCELKVLFPPDR